MLNDPHRRRCWSCGHEDTYRDGILPECACRKCGSADTRRLKSQAEEDRDAATAAAEARITAALAACENMPTESLTPGCVRVLFDFIHGLSGDVLIDPVIKRQATAALAAMKGV